MTGPTLSLPLCTEPSPVPTGAQCKAQAEGSKVSGEALWVLGMGVKGLNQEKKWVLVGQKASMMAFH